MTSRNVDDSGDILPVTSPGDLASGSDAAAIGLADHLRCAERIKRSVDNACVTVFILIDKVLIDVDSAEDQRIDILIQSISDHVRLIAAENYLVTVGECGQITVYRKCYGDVA